MHWLQEARAFLQSLVEASGGMQSCLLRYDGAFRDVSIVKIIFSLITLWQEAWAASLPFPRSLAFHELVQMAPVQCLVAPRRNLWRDIQTSSKSWRANVIVLMRAE